MFNVIEKKYFYNISKEGSITFYMGKDLKKN
jgi:hypothetical protein